MTKEELQDMADTYGLYTEEDVKNRLSCELLRIGARNEELEKENAELKEAIQHINPCYEWNDDVHDCEFMHYAMKYGGKLTEATAIIKGLLESCFGPTSKTVNYEIKSRAEHFLKEE